jgi:hypothetical protein
MTWLWLEDSASNQADGSGERSASVLGPMLWPVPQESLGIHGLGLSLVLITVMAISGPGLQLSTSLHLSVYKALCICLLL